MCHDTEIAHRARGAGKERQQFVVRELSQRAPVRVGEDDSPERSTLHVNRNAGLGQLPHFLPLRERRRLDRC